MTLPDGSPDLVAVYSRLSVIEHCRWVRMHLAGGWIYDKKKAEMLLHHNCILPFEDLADYVILYDTLNCMWAVADAEKD